MATKRSSKISYECTECGYVLSKWMGRCPSCGEWGTLEERRPATASAAGSRSGSRHLAGTTSDALPVTEIDPQIANHIPTGSAELDRVLGGGIVPGSAVLLAGEPGVGKSTLLLEVSANWAKANRSVLIITAEESVGQVRHRAERTNALSEKLYIAAEHDLEQALHHVDTVNPELIIVDSLQTMNASGVEGVPGGVTQTRAVTSTLTTLAKQSGTPVLAVGHVTKDGNVAGPRTIEHLVDVVLHFEGDQHSSLRFLRGIKNRFGPTEEVGCFEQTAEGIKEVTDPSGLFLNHRTESVTGTAVTVKMDGRRALVGEIQTLAVETEQGNPKRFVTGIESGRVSMMLAVLAQRCGMQLGRREVYAATVGGMRISEPAADLALGLALASTAEDEPLPLGLCAMGEVGLGGEVRRIPEINQRLSEAARLGMKHAIIPAGTSPSVPKGLEVHQVKNIGQALGVVRRLREN